MNTAEAKLSIEKKVKEDVFGLFGQGEFKEGSRILQGLSFRLQNDDDTELQRLVLKNLSFAFYKIDDMSMARKYAIRIMAIVNEDETYQKTNKEGYADVLNLYSEFVSDKFTTQDKIKINKINRSIYYNNNEYLDKYYIAESNISILKKNYEEIIDIIECIHNKKLDVIFEDEKKDIEIKNKLTEAIVIITKDLQSDSPIIYKRLMESMKTLNQSNKATVM